MFLKKTLDKASGLLVLCLLCVGVQQVGAAGLIKAKAWLAPILIEQAWQRSLNEGGSAVRPWPWADTWPVAKLSVPAHNTDLLVLAGDSGNALAFGPGYALASAPLGSPGLSVIGGHRDTHFEFLQAVRRGQLLELQLPSGQQRHYRVDNSRVVDARRERLPVNGETEALLLVTCYPFNALSAGGPLRYVVTAFPIYSPADALVRSGSLKTPYQL